MQAEWVYQRPYYSNRKRLDALPGFLAYYNHRRPHGGIRGATPASRLSTTTLGTTLGASSMDHGYTDRRDRMPAIECWWAVVRGSVGHVPVPASGVLVPIGMALATIDLRGTLQLALARSAGRVEAWENAGNGVLAHQCGNRGSRPSSKPVLCAECRKAWGYRYIRIPSLHQGSAPGGGVGPVGAASRGSRRESQAGKGARAWGARETGARRDAWPQPLDPRERARE